MFRFGVALSCRVGQKYRKGTFDFYIDCSLHERFDRSSVLKSRKRCQRIRLTLQTPLLQRYTYCTATFQGPGSVVSPAHDPAGSTARINFLSVTWCDSPCNTNPGDSLISRYRATMVTILKEGIRVPRKPRHLGPSTISIFERVGLMRHSSRPPSRIFPRSHSSSLV